MCFSLTASFSAGLGLLICGVASLHRAKNNQRLLMIAAIPLIFGLQQLIEGFVWLSFINPAFESVRIIAAHLFLAIAGIVWPLWIPTALMRYEQSGRYVPYLGAGIIVALLFLYYVLFYPLHVEASCNLIYYFELTPWCQAVSTALYLMATVLPFFGSRNKTLWFIGSLIAIAYGIAWLFYLEAFASVWCFFAALISTFVYGFVVQESKRRGT